MLYHSWHNLESTRILKRIDCRWWFRCFSVGPGIDCHGYLWISSSCVVPATNMLMHVHDCYGALDLIANDHHQVWVVLFERKSVSDEFGSYVKRLLHLFFCGKQQREREVWWKLELLSFMYLFAPLTYITLNADTLRNSFLMQPYGKFELCSPQSSSTKIWWWDLQVCAWMCCITFSAWNFSRYKDVAFINFLREKVDTDSISSGFASRLCSYIWSAK